MSSNSSGELYLCLHPTRKHSVSIWFCLLCLVALLAQPGAFATTHSKHHPTTSARTGSTRTRKTSSTKTSSRSRGTTVASARGRHGRGSAAASSTRVATTSRWHHGRHHGATEVVADSKHHRHMVVAHHEPRHAYPMDIFLMHPPEFERDPLPPEVARKITRAFDEGHADEYAARTLVRAGVVSYHPLHGGIFWRREPVKYIIVHSTETGIPMGAVRVIESWGSAGRRHAGAQYVVDRDGTIYQACDPDLATVHVNVFKTLPGINNDNSIGIEMCHAGHQDYPPEQRQSVTRLVTYLQDRYKVVAANVVTHRYAQQGDHTDPVNFDFDDFLASKDRFRNQAIAYRVDRIKRDGASWKAVPAEAPTTVDEAVTSTVESQQGGVLPFVHHESPAASIPAVLSNPPSAKPENPSTPALRGPIEMEPGFVQKLPVKQAPAQTISPPAPTNASPVVTPSPTGSVVPVQPTSPIPTASPAVPIQNLAPQAVPARRASPSTVPGADGKTPEDTRFFVQPPSVP